jgi:hypothetical protein
MHTLPRFPASMLGEVLKNLKDRAGGGVVVGGRGGGSTWNIEIAAYIAWGNSVEGGWVGWRGYGVKRGMFGMVKKAL